MKPGQTPAFQPGKPDVIYASAYQRRRAVGQMIGGGPEGGIYKTTNGGLTWDAVLTISENTGITDVIFDCWSLITACF